MPCCNGADTGLNVTRPEREPTSDGSFIARDVEESLAGGKANDNRGFFFFYGLVHPPRLYGGTRSSGALSKSTHDDGNGVLQRSSGRSGDRVR